MPSLLHLPPGFKDIADILIEDKINQAPNECIGIVLKCFDPKDGYKILPCHNTAPDPTTDACISGRDLLIAEEYGTVKAIYHSHPNGPDTFSEKDISASKLLGIPYILVTSNNELFYYVPQKTKLSDIF